MKMWMPILKTKLFVLLLLQIGINVQSQDIPGASPNIQTAPAGSLIIAMDNTTQPTRKLSSSTGTYLFNLKSYGMVVRLLNDEVLVKWIIKTGKAKDEADFSVMAEKVAPAYVSPQNLDFKAGPFMIFPSDTSGVMEIINYVNANIVDSARVSVYRSTVPVDVDVRYNLVNPPRVAILDYLSECDLHANYMYAASVPWVNWECTNSSTVLRSGCFSIVTVPHTDLNLLQQEELDSINNFIFSGGNFLGQCESVNTFESSALYQVDDGQLTEPANGGNQNGFNANVYYDNPDMAMSQFEGDIKPRLRGAFQRWNFTGNSINNFYSVVSCRKQTGDELFYTATVSKHYSGEGGLVFYIGNHEFFTEGTGCGCAGYVAADEAKEINGIRMYMNAILVPTTLVPCLPLSVKLGEFTAKKQNSISVLLQWNSLYEKNNDYFHVEHSTDGRNYKLIGKIRSKGDSFSGYDYSLTHNSPQIGINYYRIKIKDVDGKIIYSQIRTIVFGKNNHNLSLYPNPASRMVIVELDEKDGTRVSINIFDVTSRLIRSAFVLVKDKRASIDIGDFKNGVYFVIATASDGEKFKNKLIISRK